MKRHYFIIKKTLYQEQTTKYLFSANMGVPKYRNQLKTNIQKLTDNNTMTGDFNNHVCHGPIIYAENQQGNNSLDTLDHRDSTDIVWRFIPKAEYTFLSNAHGTFSRTDHSWPTNQPSTGTTGTRRLISHPAHFRTRTLWNSKLTVRKNLDIAKIRGDYEHPTREWMEQPGN